MSNQSLILAEEFFGFQRFAWYYQEKMQAVHVAFEDEMNATSQIHYGRVTKVSEAMKGAFMELAGGQQAFLPLSAAKGFTPLSEGQYLVVQVLRDAREEKDLRVTTNINLRGLYWVLFPHRPGPVKLSRKINAQKDAERILEIAESWSEDYGITARTAARSESDEKLQAELEGLSGLWQHIMQSIKGLKKPTMLADFGHPLLRLLLEDVEVEPEAIIFNHKSFLDKTATKLEENLYFPPIDLAVGNSEELFEDFNIDEDFWTLFQKKISLKGGGSLIIETTAAATLIDVNAGGQKAFSPAQAAEVNFAACHEIARQIRLRNMGGQILIDFISVKDKNHQQKLTGRMRQILKYDSMHPDILGFSRLGLMEMTRKQMGQNLQEKIMQSAVAVRYQPAVAQALILKQIENGLRKNPQVAFKLYGRPKALKDIEPKIQQISPPKMEFCPYDGALKLEIF